AAQSILGDFFASLTILFDRPFQIGDSIVAGDISGTVERIGIKTSRIRSITGELIIVSNSNITSARIRNFRQMEDRRVTQRLGVTLQTSPEQCRLIPQTLREIVLRHEMARFDRAHFVAFGDYSLLFELVYVIRSPEAMVWLDLQQEINFEILEAFSAQGIQ